MSACLKSEGSMMPELGYSPGPSALGASGPKPLGNLRDPDSRPFLGVAPGAGWFQAAPLWAAHLLGTIIRRAMDQAVEAIEKEGRVQDLVHALRRLAGEDPKLAEILRTFHLL